MRRFQFEFENEKEFVREMEKLRAWSKRHVTNGMIFQIMANTLDKDKIRQVCGHIERYFPDADYSGCTTGGNIMLGDMGRAEIGIICTVVEYPDTRAEIWQLPFDPENPGIGKRLQAYIDENPWVKAVELYTAFDGKYMSEFCESFHECREDVSIFGGAAFTPNMNEDGRFVFSKGNGFLENAVLVQMIGGPDFHLITMHITGWKALGRAFTVTKADFNRLYELDGQPAFEVYSKYLNIKNDEHFFDNALEFPIFYKQHDLDILRAPASSNEDGSLNMSSGVDENVTARLAYGDASVILDSVKEENCTVAAFKPDVIDVFSCVARRVYWGEAEVGRETLPFEAIAPSAGFFTGGELLRTGEFVNLHNVTLVIAALREGEADGDREVCHVLSNEQESGRINMIKRFTNFINVATAEMEEANRKLALAAITDAMTGLYNRGEIQRRISERVQSEEAKIEPTSLIMMDLDDFKHVNDTCGHQEGDRVLIGLATTLRDTLEAEGVTGNIGRWGGEEFMILLPGKTAQESAELAQKLRENFAKVKFELAGNCTMSLGVTAFTPGEPGDTFTKRVDALLYEAKAAGKNCVMKG